MLSCMEHLPASVTKSALLLCYIWKDFTEENKNLRWTLTVLAFMLSISLRMSKFPEVY